MDGQFEAVRNDRPAPRRGTINEPHLAGVLRGLVFVFVAGIIFLAVSFMHSFLQLSWNSYGFTSPRSVLKFAITRDYQ